MGQERGVFIRPGQKFVKMSGLFGSHAQCPAAQEQVATSPSLKGGWGEAEATQFDLTPAANVNLPNLPKLRVDGFLESHIGLTLCRDRHFVTAKNRVRINDRRRDSSAD